MSTSCSTSTNKEWIGFPTSSFLNPISSPYNFTNPLSKTVLLIGDNNYVSKHTASYLDTTLHVSGFKVTKFTSISSAPLSWTNNESITEETKDKDKDNHFWEYKLDLNDFDCILIPSQINGDIWNDITQETKDKIKLFVEKGGCLICCHFRGTNFINSVCDTFWHEISVKIGTSYHVKKENDILNYVNDVRGIVNIKNENIIYKTKDDFTTVGFNKIGNGYCYYIGHDFSAIWEKTWNKILFNSIKKLLTNSKQETINLNFGDIDIEAFKNLNIESNNKDETDGKDIYLEEFQPDFNEMDVENKTNEKDEKEKKNKIIKDDTTKSFDDFDELNGFDDDLETNDNNNNNQNEYESIGYYQMDDNGVITINNHGVKLQVDLTDNNANNHNHTDDNDENEFEEID